MYRCEECGLVFEKAWHDHETNEIKCPNCAGIVLDDIDFINETHTYLFNGVIVESVTQIIKDYLNISFDFVDPQKLEEARDKGTEMHAEIEAWEKARIKGHTPELKQWIKIKKENKLKVVENEKMVVLMNKGKPFTIGRFDCLIKTDAGYGIIDFKRTKSLNKKYVTLQLNVYRKALIQKNGMIVNKLYACQLHGETGRLVEIPIVEGEVNKLIKAQEEKTWKQNT